ncbi:MAG TPA: hypothetical protein DGG95_14230 [Cytophagales bacterium]|jgi:hypothetical protein|nr:hypothetical protein [Cytophagales bacterium]
MKSTFIYSWACPSSRTIGTRSGCTLQVRPRTHQRTSGFPLPSLTLKLFLVLVLSHVQTFLFAQKELSLTDKVYEPQIKTVLLYADTENPLDYLQPASTPYNMQTMVLEFDDLQDNRNNYYAKLIHCNYDWTKSSLADLDFLENYNEYNITDYTFSNATYSRFVHYRFQIPPVKYTGNYVVIVYRNDQSDLVLSHRMMIYDNQIALNKDNQLLGIANLNPANQQFNFVLDYGDTQVINPMESIHVNMRQNQRWDNAKFNLQPSFVRDADSELDYRFLDDSWQFTGGNEFRFADFRSLNNPGQNTRRLNKSVKPFELDLAIDAPRGDGTYSQYKDLDGCYIIDNLDYGEPNITGNYLYVNFTLKSETPYNGDVYLVGRFNDYQRTVENKMKYNEARQAYESRQFVKQGWYDFQYILDSKKEPTTVIEGSHFETENVYEIAVYYHPFRPNADLLIGYYLIQVNQH